MRKPNTERKLYINWDMIWEDIQCLADKIKRNHLDYYFDLVVGIERGGNIPAAMLARVLNLPFETRDYRGGLDSYKGFHVLFMDDVFDTGKTYNYIYDKCQVYEQPQLFATLYKKDVEINLDYKLKQPDVFARQSTSEWIIFPWEIEASRVRDR